LMNKYSLVVVVAGVLLIDLCFGRSLAAEPKLRSTLKGHTNWLLCVSFSPDGKTLASSGWDSTIKLWDVATGKNTATFKGHIGPIMSVAFSPDGKTLASGGKDKTIKLCDLPGDKKDK